LADTKKAEGERRGYVKGEGKTHGEDGDCAQESFREKGTNSRKQEIAGSYEGFALNSTLCSPKEKKVKKGGRRT